MITLPTLEALARPGWRNEPHRLGTALAAGRSVCDWLVGALLEGTLRQGR